MAELKLPPRETLVAVAVAAARSESWEEAMRDVDMRFAEHQGAVLRAVADRAAQMSQECNQNVPAGFPLIDLMNELRAAAYKIGCQHERLNDNEDACLDCGAVFVDGKWQ